MKKRKLFFCFFLTVFLLFGCEKDEKPNPVYVYSVPEQVDDGWICESTESVSLDTIPLIDMMNYINSTSNHNIHNILIIKDSKLVFEEYFDGYLYSSDPPGSNGEFITYDREVDHFLASVSKSITSVIFGIAVKEGYIDNLNEKVVDIFPEYSDILTGEKTNITLKQLLTMSSGLDWDESSVSYENPANDVVQLFNSEDPIEYILSLPMVSLPGTEFLYNSGGTNVLGAVIQKKTEMSLLDFGNQYLFDPLNVEGGIWQRLPGGNFFASGGIFLRPRELAKIGYLFLNDGYWEDQQIISENWITASVTNHINTEGRTLPLAYGYGYQWWLQNYNVNGILHQSFMAAGWGDQYMIIFPDQNMMVIFNGGNYWSSGSISPFDLVEDYILRAL